MRTFLLLCMVQMGLMGFSQERCSSADYLQTQQTADPLRAAAIANAETFIQKRLAAAPRQKAAPGSVIKIPVVVHVIYNQAAQNISDEQIRTQLAALNRDFRRTNTDTSNTPAQFRELAADVQIEFYLATSDPKGRPTSGIVRRQTNVMNWINNDRIKFSAQGGDDAWDSKSYLNIWVGRLVSGAGYASAPGGDPAKDGVVVSSTAFGTVNVSAYYNLGRTTVHEVGHWLGLKHIWGDARCGDDAVDDTPQQGWYTTDCPTGFRSSCSNAATGDMYMNYMDYTADACMNLFTEGQKARMRATFDDGGPRASLLQSKGLKQPEVSETLLPDLGTKPSLHPNPVQTELTVRFQGSQLGQTVFVLGANGALVQTLQVRAVIQKINVTALRSGVYFLRGEGFSQKFIKL